MANNTIALQARPPRTDILGGSIQRNAQMINMMRQQDAADRQAAAAAKNAEIAAAQEARAAAKEGRDIATFELDRDAKIYAKHRAAAPTVAQGGPEVYALWLDDYRTDNPKVAAIIEKAMPVDQFDADKFILMMGTMDQRFAARYGNAITKELIGPGGEMFGANISSIPGASYAAPLPDISKPKTGTPPPAAGGNAPAGGLKPTRGANTTPADLRPQMAPAGPATPDRLEAAARAAARGARATDPIFDGLTDDEFRQMQTRADEIRAGNASMKPASFDGGAAQPDLGGIVQQMMQTGVVSQSNLQALRAAAGPDKEQQLAQILRSSNIKIMPDEQQVGGMRDAVYRPDEGMPVLQQAQYNPNDYAQVRVKSPMQAPETAIPGSAKVPLKRLGAEKRVEAQAQKDVEMAAEQAKKIPGKKQVSTILGKMRDAYEALEKAEAIPSEKRGGFANAVDYLASSSLGREAQKFIGTEESKYLSRITNMRKALATAIKNATGMSAQEMNSNAELQLTLDTLTDPTQGIEAARMALNDLEELYGLNAPATAPASKQPKPSPADVQAVRRNRDKKEWTEGFRRQFGDKALQQALGGR